jgi:hypothetical protein
MSESKAASPAARTYLWWSVLGLVGLDYFSTLAYVPSMAVEAADRLAPLAALGVVVATLLGALPIYLYVVGRSPQGSGATGLLERLVPGWVGKVLVLVLLGFVATDYVITRSLSLADATVHLINNPFWQDHVEWIANNRDTVRQWFPEQLQGNFFDFWNERLVVTVLLAAVVFFFWTVIHLGFTPFFLRVAALLTVVYLLLTGIVIGSGLWYLAANPQQLNGWFEAFRVGMTSQNPNWIGAAGVTALVAFSFFPSVALGLSGFELSMASAPLVRGRLEDTPEHPRGRVRNTRKLMVFAALIMSVYLVGAVLVSTLLVPKTHLELRPRPNDAAPPSKTGGRAPEKPLASERALAYLAHGAPFVGPDGRIHNDEALSPLFGPWFGSAYDLITVLVLCLAGISVSIGLRDLLPRYLARYGMQLRWAQRIGVITHLINITILVVTVVFRASVSAQQWAYATSVMVLLTAASLAAVLDVRHRLTGSWLRFIAPVPFSVIGLFFLTMTGLLLWHSLSGLAIALILVVLVVMTAFVSRWLRSTELRFEGFTFNDDKSKQRWEEVRQLHFQVLVPHRPEHMTLREKERDVRSKHRLAEDVPIIFIEVQLGDPSDFFQQPLMEIYKENDLEVIRVSRCSSVAHVLAALGLEFRQVGEPPEIYFDWSNEQAMAANLNFLLWGQGNIPWLVHELVRKAEPDPKRRPRVLIG